MLFGNQGTVKKAVTYLTLYTDMKEVARKTLPQDATEAEVNDMAKKVTDILFRKDEEKFRLTQQRFWLQLAGQIIPLIIALVAILKR